MISLNDSLCSASTPNKPWTRCLALALTNFHDLDSILKEPLFIRETSAFMICGSYCDILWLRKGAWPNSVVSNVTPLGQMSQASVYDSPWVLKGTSKFFFVSQNRSTILRVLDDFRVNNRYSGLIYSDEPHCFFECLSFSALAIVPKI